jgi:hypothetical protein
MVKTNLPNNQRGESEEETTQNKKDHGNNHSCKEVDGERFCVAEAQIWKIFVLDFPFWIKNKITNSLSGLNIFNTCVLIIK